jgi:osmotically-inducible protein OsmY
MSTSALTLVPPIAVLNDPTLPDRVLAFLRMRGLLSGEVKVSEHEGAIVLGGTVGLYHERQIALTCAKHVAGVRRVVDRISVVPRQQRASDSQDR